MYLYDTNSRPDTTDLLKFFKNLKKNPRTQSPRHKPTFNTDAQITIDYIEAPCGAGKTYGLVEAAKALADQGELVVIKQPTMLLNSETRKSIGFEGWNGNLVEISGDGSVKRFRERCEIKDGYKPAPGIILTTHGTILNIREPFDGMQNIHLFGDEILPGADEFNLELSMHHVTITDHLEIVEESTDGGWVRLEMIDGHDDDLRNILKHRKKDTLCGKLFDPTLAFLSNSYDIWVRRHSYANLLSGLFEDGKSHILSFYFELRPEIYRPWKSTLLAGANFKNSLLYLSFQDKEVVFREDLTTPLRFRTHQNGHLIDLFDFGKDKLSQKWLKREHEGISYGQHIANDGAKLFDGEPFVWTENSTLEYKLESFGGERLPNYPFGLNSFSGVHNILCLHAANPTPGFESFLKWRGRTDDQIWKAIQGESVYQAATRISIRDPNSLERKTILVASKEAQFLRELFPINDAALELRKEKLRVQNLPDHLFEPGKPGQPRKHQSESERLKAYRDHHRILNVRLSLLLEGISVHSLSDGPNPNPNPQLSPKFKCVKASIFETIYHKFAYDIFEGDLFDLLRDTYRRTFKAKDDTYLICPAIFDPNQGDGKTKKGLQNIVSIDGFIAFDFEKGHLRLDDWGSILPGKEGFISNSFNSTKESPRGHAFFPLTREVTVEEFNFIWEQIIIRIESSGFSVGKDRKGFKRSGIDTSKRPACSLFYLPSQAKDPEASFCIELTGTPIDPDEWLANPVYPAEGSYVEPEAPRMPREGHPRPSNKPVDLLEAVQEAKDRWRATHGLDEVQNAAFNQLGWDLAKARMDTWDIESTLNEELSFANNRVRRQKQIEPIIRDIEAWRAG